ncbi:hypothetical protein [Actinocorallia lasiicapitis]
MTSPASRPMSAVVDEVLQVMALFKDSSVKDGDADWSVVPQS